VAGWRIYLELERWRVRCPRCDGVHVEHLDWLAKNPHYTQRYAMHVGKLCRDMPNKTIAGMESLHHSTVASSVVGYPFTPSDYVQGSPISLELLMGVHKVVVQKSGLER